jgi:hypothetical protein
MSKKHNLFSLGAALASLASTSVVGAEAKTVVGSTDANASGTQNPDGSEVKANAYLKVGDDLLGFVTTTRSDGTLVAQGHASHASHASHSSHTSSHY